MNDQIQEIEIDKQLAMDAVETANALRRLYQNADFQRVIVSGYLEDEAIRLVHLKGDVNVQRQDQQEMISRDIDAIGSFKQFLRTVLHKEEMTLNALEDYEEALRADAEEEYESEVVH